MGERRDHKLLWDTEDETKHMSGMREQNSWAGKDHHYSHGSGLYHDLSDSRTTSIRDSRDHSGWESWEPIEEHPIAPMSRNFKSSYEAKEMSGGKRYHKSITPEFEEMELHGYNHTHEYDRSHSQRYMRKGRSRSPSRSRTRRRSRSRSLSEGRERERERERESERGRGRGTGRERERERRVWSRSRSRSRSDGYGYTNARRRSRSPIGNYMRQSHGWSDKRSGPEKSSQTCRDFASGRCRKGSQCRFFHPISTSSRDDDPVEDDRVESWRSRSDHSQISRHSYTRSGLGSRNDVSDLYHGEDEQFLHRSRSRSSIPCRDFKQGYCRWGDACRFSHDAASADSFGQDTRHSTFNKEEFDHQQHKTGKPLCKFFAAGRCSRDNCRFSHEDGNLNNLGGRLGTVTKSQSSPDKSNWRNAPKWDDTTRTSDTPKFTGWGEAIATHTTNPEDRLEEVTEVQSSHDKSNWCNAPKWDHATRTSDTPKFTGWGEAIATHTTNPEGRLDEVTEIQSSHDKSNWCNAPTWDDATRTSDPPKSIGWGEAIATHTTNPERRLDEVTEIQSSRDKSDWRNAPKWDDAMRTSDTPKSTDWGEAIATHSTSSGDATNGQTDDRWGLNSKNANKWGIQDWTSKSLGSERHHLLLRESGSYGGDTGPAKKSFAVDNIANKQEHLVFHDLQQNKDHIANLHGLSAVEENQSLTVKALHQNVPPASHMQHQHCEGIKSNPMTSYGSGVLDEVKDTKYANRPVLLSGEGFNQNVTKKFPGHSSVLNESDRPQNMLYTNSSIGHDTDLKRPETHIINPINVQIHGQNDKRTVLSPGFLEAKVPQILTNLLTSIHSDQVNNSPTNVGQQVSAVADPVSLIQSFVKERSLTYAGIDVSSSRGMLPSFSSTTGSLPLLSTPGVQDNVHAASLDQFNSTGNDKEYTVSGNHNLAQGTQQSNQMPLGISFPSSIIAEGVESPKLKHPESPKQQGEVVASVRVGGDSKVTGDESKDLPENVPSKDGQGKLEEDSANKDEKWLRLFKNSLVELVKDILKPTWKEGHMSIEAYKNIVKKVVDKVSSTIQVDHVPKAQDKIDQYLSLSKPKIAKLVQAYVERYRKPET